MRVRLWLKWWLSLIMRTLFIIMQGNIKVLAISSCEAKICNSLGDSSPPKRLSPSSGWQQTWTFYSSTHLYLRFTTGANSIIRLWLHFLLTTLCRDWEPNSSQSHHLGILFRGSADKYFLLWSYFIEKTSIHLYLCFTAGAASITRLWLYFRLTTLCRDWEPNSC